MTPVTASTLWMLVCSANRRELSRKGLTPKQRKFLKNKLGRTVEPSSGLECGIYWPQYGADRMALGRTGWADLVPEMRGVPEHNVFLEYRLTIYETVELCLTRLGQIGNAVVDFVVVPAHDPDVALTVCVAFGCSIVGARLDLVRVARRRVGYAPFFVGRVAIVPYLPGDALPRRTVEVLDDVFVRRTWRVDREIQPPVGMMRVHVAD